MIVDGYNGNPNLKRAGVSIQFTEDQVKEFALCALDPVYFIENHVKIVNVDEGLIPFAMRPYQQNMVNTFHENRFTIAKMPRQVGKTSTTVGYMLWCVLFNDNYNIAILANKGALAREILSRIQLAYEYLPNWLQQGIIIWNRGNIELENGSKILAGSTSSSAVRGSSYNLIFLDEFAFVPTNMAYSFFMSTYPTISSGSTTKVIIVSTPNGLNLFYKMWMDAIEKRSLYKPLEIHWSDVPGRDEKWREETIRNTSEEQFAQEFECEFLGSAATLISGPKLRQLSFINPIYHDDNLDIYEYPNKGKKDDAGNWTEMPHIYCLTVDTSRGLGGDYSAFSVIDVSQIPYKQVAKYKSNDIAPILFPNIIYDVGTKYNDAYVLVEINDIGQQVVDLLHKDLEYDNIFKIESSQKKGQNISAGHKKGIQFGLRTTTKTKRIGCANLKTLVESDKLIVNDFDTINELSTFVRKKDSYEAEEGNNDDLAMTLVLFGWMISQGYFKDSTNTDLRKSFMQEQLEMIEQDLTPFGFIEDGIRTERKVESGDIWLESATNYLPSNL